MLFVICILSDFAFTLTVFSTGFITVLFSSSSPFTVGVFTISSLPALAVTVTVNVTDASPCAGTVRSIPCSNSVSVTVGVIYPITVISPFKVVPPGTVSAIVTVPSLYPLFVAVIVYVIVSPGYTVLLSLTTEGVLVFITDISGFT